MTDPKKIKAYIHDASGQLVPLDVDSLVLEFPSGNSLEIDWDAQHPDDPGPVCVGVWGGRRIRESTSEEEMLAQTRPIGILPSAANLVLVYPVSYADRQKT